MKWIFIQWPGEEPAQLQLDQASSSGSKLQDFRLLAIQKFLPNNLKTFILHKFHHGLLPLQKLIIPFINMIYTEFQ